MYPASGIEQYAALDDDNGSELVYPHEPLPPTAEASTHNDAPQQTGMDSEDNRVSFYQYYAHLDSAADDKSKKESDIPPPKATNLSPPPIETRGDTPCDRLSAHNNPIQPKRKRKRKFRLYGEMENAPIRRRLNTNCDQISAEHSAKFKPLSVKDRPDYSENQTLETLNDSLNTLTTQFRASQTAFQTPNFSSSTGASADVTFKDQPDWKWNSLDANKADTTESEPAGGDDDGATEEYPSDAGLGDDESPTINDIDGESCLSTYSIHSNSEPTAEATKRQHNFTGGRSRKNCPNMSGERVLHLYKEHAGKDKTTRLTRSGNPKRGKKLWGMTHGAVKSAFQVLGCFEGTPSVGSVQQGTGLTLGAFLKARASRIISLFEEKHNKKDTQLWTMERISTIDRILSQ